MAPLAISLGDPSGIGPEIVGKAWAMREEADLPPFFAVGDAATICHGWTGPIARIDSPGEAAGVFGAALPVMHIFDCGRIRAGEPSVEGARCALAALEMATGLTRSGPAAALVTAPVSKAELYAIGFSYPGQTEFVAERCGVARNNAVMMLAGPTLRVVPVTTHIPLADVPTTLTTELIITKARATARGLARDFGIEQPRLAVAAFNPHAGEMGLIGREEIEIIAPAVEALNAEGIEAFGPIAPDALFHPRARATYDAAICMYHDQALIPLKALHFDEGVNITLGLPIIRTSPDHGTAFGIAGRNLANPGAMVAAIRMAGEAARTRDLTLA
ncbi:MAG: 4-hydroxythreonine-4-phosphate dehydrogenase PdxA [Pseudomonadota bacterium]